MKKALHQFLFFLSLACASSTWAQGLIVNEISNGASGAKEFFELLVIGDPAAPMAPVNLSGWIIDDNNGSFEASTGAGVATGHFRIAAGCYTNVPVGAIFIIYNAGDRETIIPANDPNDSNGDLVYIIPHTSTCLEVCTSAPSSSPANSNYNIGSCTYVATTLAGSSSWSAVSLGNSGDAVQTRRPDGSFFHGYSYGDVGAPFPTFAAEIGGGSSFNVATGSGSGFAYGFSCDGFNAATAFSRVAAASATPGAFNDSNNGNLIQNIRNGTYLYSDPTNLGNCDLILPLNLIDFQADIYNLHRNILTWRLSKVDPNSRVNIQRSSDSYNFTTVQQLPLEEYLGEQDYNYIDFTPWQTTYYRLEFIEPNAKISYSDVRVVSQKTDATLRIFPNPTNEQLNLALATPLSSVSRCEVIDALGRTLIQTELPADNTAISIDVQTLPAGHYFLRFSNENMSTMHTFIKL
jgi:hypothetical protein